MASFQGLGATNAYADAVSADGSTVVGNSLTVGAFYWKQSTGTVPLFPNFSGSLTSPTASGVSGDGSIIVGTLPTTISPSSPKQAFRWTSGSGAVTLPALASAIYSTGNAISEDGTVIAGDTDFSGYESGYTVKNNGLTIIPPQTTPGLTLAQGTTVSADGSVVAGTYFGTTAGFGGSPYVYANNTFTPISDGTAFSGTATAVSADGSFVVGERNFTGTTLAFDWTQQSGPVNLVMPAGINDSTATGVSSGGSTIVGYMSATPSVFYNENGVAFIWNQTSGEQNLQQVLTTQYGLGAALAGWTLNEATAITPDGNTIVGIGIDPQGHEESWIVNLNSNVTTAPAATVTLTSTPNPSEFGQVVTFTATVAAATSGLPIPTGAVTFYDGSTDLGTSELDDSGIATFTTSTLAVGSHSITAVYGGDDNFSGAASSPVAQTIEAAEQPDLIMDSAEITSDDQDVEATYTIDDGDLPSPASIDFYWASGTTVGSIIPTPDTPVVVYSDDDPGTYTTPDPKTSQLGPQPDNATNIIVVANSADADPNHDVVSVPIPSAPSTVTVSIDSSYVVPSAATNLSLYSFFGNESLNVPVVIANSTQSPITDGVLELYLSQSNDGNPPFVLLSNNTTGIDVSPGQSVTITVQANVVPDFLAVAGKYYFVAKFVYPNTPGETPTGQAVGATNRTFEFLGTPTDPDVFDEDSDSISHYFNIVTDDLKNTNPFTKTGTSLLGPPTTASGLQFTAAFEINGGYLNPDQTKFKPYLVAGHPTIGIGLDLVTGLTKSIKKALGLDVRAYYLANYHQDLKKLDDDQIVSMLKQQAHSHGKSKTALTLANVQALYQMTYSDAQKRAIKFVGSSAWTLLTTTAKTTITDIAFNGIGGFRRLKTDLRASSVDYVLAGFDMLDSVRTESQVGYRRSLADYEYLVYGLNQSIGSIIS